MTEPIQKPLDRTKPPGLFPALVIAAHDGRATVRALHTLVEVTGARSAVVGYTPQVGDRVLVQVLEDESAYLTGVLHTRQEPRLQTPSGASAELDAARETLRLSDAGGQLVCEFDGTTGRLIVHTRGEVEVTTSGAALGFNAARITFNADLMELRAKTLTAEFEQATWTAERWELRATRLAERARDKLVDIENALHLRAGRVRSLVSETWELVSRRTRMVSKENTSIDGEKILLG
jgi:hypothetical protein